MPPPSHLDADSASAKKGLPGSSWLCNGSVGRGMGQDAQLSRVGKVPAMQGEVEGCNGGWKRWGHL